METRKAATAKLMIKRLFDTKTEQILSSLSRDCNGTLKSGNPVFQIVAADTYSHVHIS